MAMKTLLAVAASLATSSISATAQTQNTYKPTFQVDHFAGECADGGTLPPEVSDNNVTFGNDTTCHAGRVVSTKRYTNISKVTATVDLSKVTQDYVNASFYLVENNVIPGQQPINFPEIDQDNLHHYCDAGNTEFSNKQWNCREIDFLETNGNKITQTTLHLGDYPSSGPPDQRYEYSFAATADNSCYNYQDMLNSPKPGNGLHSLVNGIDMTKPFVMETTFDPQSATPGMKTVFMQDGNTVVVYDSSAGTGAQGSNPFNQSLYQDLSSTMKQGYWILASFWQGFSPTGPNWWTGTCHKGGLCGNDTKYWALTNVEVTADAELGPGPATHDLNANMTSDIVWRDTGGDVAVWLMSGASVVSSAGLGNVPTTWSIVGQRDFDGDGKTDLLWRDTTGNMAIWFMNGTQVAASAGVGNIPTTWSVIATGDFDGDGKGDILWRDDSGNLGVWLMNGAAASSTGGLGNVPSMWSVIGTGDFNGDGKSDLLWRDNLGNTSIWFMSGTQVASSAGIPSIPTSWSVVGTGDFNGDGFTDIVWRDSSGNTSIWLMNGANVAATGSFGTIPMSWSLVQTGDFNGDGKSDLLWRDASGNTSMWFMNGVTFASVGDLGNIPTTWTAQAVNAE
jgi:hypothetical protein